MSYSLILASSSFSRQNLLKNTGLHFIVLKPNIDEREIEENLSLDDKENPEKIALLLAERKALEVGMRYPESVVIGCDQTMGLGSKIYHKPKDIFEAEQHLISLSGRTHHINSAYSLVRNNMVLRYYISTAQLTMRSLSKEFIQKYLEKVGNEILSSVGCYQIEKEGIQLFEAIKGSYFTILGLPILELLKDLRKEQVID